MGYTLLIILAIIFVLLVIGFILYYFATKNSNSDENCHYYTDSITFERTIGSTCNLYDRCRSDSGGCYIKDGENIGICISGQFKDINEKCDLSNPCSSPNICENGICKALLGGYCENITMCSSEANICQDNVCLAENGRLNDPCDNLNLCMPGYTCIFNGTGSSGITGTTGSTGICKIADGYPCCNVNSSKVSGINSSETKKEGKNSRCGPNSICDIVCTPIPEEGMPCTISGKCGHGLTCGLPQLLENGEQVYSFLSGKECHCYYNLSSNKYSDISFNNTPLTSGECRCLVVEILDITGYKNSKLILLSDGNLYIDNNKTAYTILTSIKMQSITNFGGNIYGLSHGNLYQRDPKLSQKDWWHWSQVSWFNSGCTGPYNVVGLTGETRNTKTTGCTGLIPCIGSILNFSSSHDGEVLWIQTSAAMQNGTLWQYVPGSSTPQQILSLTTSLTRVYGGTSDTYLEINSTNNTATLTPGGTLITDIVAGAINNNGSVIKISQENSNLYRIIRSIDNDEYLITYRLCEV